ncbi:hypothetical protein V7S43_019015 [Phytophthora oleae]|uniref:Uncharacterized protein n=1 Tax=Phytophthora oleae TaxID=2107226 RepID=A0ABD3EP30_9STRA
MHVFIPDTGMSPFVADIGYNPRSVADLAIPSTAGRSQGALEFVQQQKVILQQCKDALEQAQAWMKYFHDRNQKR